MDGGTGAISWSPPRSATSLPLPPLLSAGRYIPEQVSTSGISEERWAVAFLLFLPPKPSVKPNSVRQTDPRSFHFFGGHLVWLQSSSASRLAREYDEHQGDGAACIRGTPVDRYNDKSKNDDGHEGRQDLRLADVAGHFLPTRLPPPRLTAVAAWLLNVSQTGDLPDRKRQPSRLETIPSGAQSDAFLIVLMAFAGPRHPRNFSVFASSAFVARKNSSSSLMARAGIRRTKRLRPGSKHHLL